MNFIFFNTDGRGDRFVIFLKKTCIEANLLIIFAPLLMRK